MPRKKPEAQFWASRPILSHIRHLANCKGQSPWPLLGWIIVRTLHTVPWDVRYKSMVVSSPGFGRGSVRPVPSL